MIEEKDLENKMLDVEENKGIAATEAARELADELGIDLETVEGTGSGGQIIKADVERAFEDLYQDEPQEVETTTVTATPQSGGTVLIRMKPSRSVKLANRLYGPGKEIEVSRSVADWLLQIDYAVIVRG